MLLLGIGRKLGCSHLSHEQKFMGEEQEFKAAAASHLLCVEGGTVLLAEQDFAFPSKQEAEFPCY